jgi:large subunit ribosomal protein L23
MRSPYQIIRQPLITEKSTIQREKHGTYCFKVHPGANKVEIAWAVEKLFGGKGTLKVAQVRTSLLRGKMKRMGRFLGKRPNWKKAWVKLTPDSAEIQFFEAS